MVAQNEINIAVLLGGLIAGCVCGLLPLLVGMKKQQNGLAVGGMIACLLSAVILTLEVQNYGLAPVGMIACLLTGALLDLVLAGPVALVFLLLILGASASRTTGQQLRNNHRSLRALAAASASQAAPGRGY